MSGLSDSNASLDTGAEILNTNSSSSSSSNSSSSSMGTKDDQVISEEDEIDIELEEVALTSWSWEEREQFLERLLNYRVILLLLIIFCLFCLFTISYVWTILALLVLVFLSFVGVRASVRVELFSFKICWIGFSALNAVGVLFVIIWSLSGNLKNISVERCSFPSFASTYADSKSELTPEEVCNKEVFANLLVEMICFSFAVCLFLVWLSMKTRAIATYLEGKTQWIDAQLLDPLFAEEEDMADDDDDSDFDEMMDEEYLAKKLSEKAAFGQEQGGDTLEAEVGALLGNEGDADGIRKRL